MSAFKELARRNIEIFFYVTAGWFGAIWFREWIISQFPMAGKSGLATLVVMTLLILTGYFLEKKINGK